MSKVLLKFKDDIIQEFLLTENPLTIGRTEDNAIRIDNLSISRNHARIIYVDGEYFIEDLNSQNGTTVNSLPIKRCALRNNDQIGVGKQNKHVLVFAESKTKRLKVAPIHKTQRRDINVGPPEETLKLGSEKSVTRRKQKMLPALKVIEGYAYPEQIFLEKVLLVAGQGNNADLQIEGNYDTDVVFIVSNRPTGFFLSPSANINLLLNDKPITEVVQLKEGHTIQFQDVKIKFVFC